MNTLFETLNQQASSMREELEQLQVTAGSFTARSGIACKSGCGVCCKRPGDVWATVAEMLPMARDIYERGDLDQLLSKLDRVDPATMCVLHKPDPNIPENGRCTEYNNRPSTCILFGSTLVTSKGNTRHFLGCHWQKEEYRENIIAMQHMESSSAFDSRAMTESIRSQVVDPKLREEFPINAALRKALELIAWSDEIRRASVTTTTPKASHSVHRPS